MESSAHIMMDALLKGRQLGIPLCRVDDGR